MGVMDTIFDGGSDEHIVVYKNRRATRARRQKLNEYMRVSYYACVNAVYNACVLCEQIATVVVVSYLVEAHIKDTRVDQNRQGDYICVHVARSKHVCTIDANRLHVVVVNIVITGCARTCCC